MAGIPVADFATIHDRAWGKVFIFANIARLLPYDGIFIIWCNELLQFMLFWAAINFGSTEYLEVVVAHQGLEIERNEMSGSVGLELFELLFLI